MLPGRNFLTSARFCIAPMLYPLDDTRLSKWKDADICEMPPQVRKIEFPTRTCSVAVFAWARLFEGIIPIIRKP
jgi:hypothetical protein